MIVDPPFQRERHGGGYSCRDKRSWLGIGRRSKGGFFGGRSPGAPDGRGTDSGGTGPDPPGLPPVVQRGPGAQDRRPEGPAMCRVPSPSPRPAQPVLLGAVPMGVPGPLLLGRGAELRIPTGPVHVPDLWASISGPFPGGRP